MKGVDENGKHGQKKRKWDDEDVETEKASETEETDEEEDEEEINVKVKHEWGKKQVRMETPKCPKTTANSPGGKISHSTLPVL